MITRSEQISNAITLYYKMLSFYAIEKLTSHIVHKILLL